MLGKRGMSPLIATILLIAFAVSIGTVIMSYGNAYYSDQAPVSQEWCQDLEVYKINGEPSVCVDGSELKYILLNKGSKTVDSLQILASYQGSSNQVEVISVGDEIPSGIYNGEARLDISKGKLVQIQFLLKSYDQNCFLEPAAIRPC